MGREGHSDSFEGALLGGSLTVTSRKQMTNPLGAPPAPGRQEGPEIEKEKKVLEIAPMGRKCMWGSDFDCQSICDMMGMSAQPLRPAQPPTQAPQHPYLGFISTLELMSSASRSYSSTWPLVHTFMRSVSSLLRGARMKS